MGAVRVWGKLLVRLASRIEPLFGCFGATCAFFNVAQVFLVWLASTDLSVEEASDTENNVGCL